MMGHRLKSTVVESLAEGVHRMVFRPKAWQLTAAAVATIFARQALAQPNDFLGRALSERSAYRYEEFSYKTVAARLDAWRGDAAAGRSNSIFEYGNPLTGFAGERFRSFLLGLARRGAFGFQFAGRSAAHEALVQVLQQLGPYVGAEAAWRAGEIAAARGDSVANFYLYLDEVRFGFVEPGVGEESTGGRAVQRGILGSAGSWQASRIGTGAR